ncbi:MAG: EamA family transporter [Verrucomicrobia bacterium]|nr:EamA family transporter [Verrucomicrobiota bacterium]
MDRQNDNQRAPLGWVIAAFSAVYIIWGSTYLAIRFAVETVPPFLMGGVRFIIAGVILYGWRRFRGAAAPAHTHWRSALLAGILLLAVGNGGLNWAAQRAPSGLTALLIAVTPFWFALLDWFRPHGQRPHIQTMLGIMVGFAGMALLISSRDSLNRAVIDIASVLTLMLASFSWAAGSLYVRYSAKPESPLLAVALQMIAGGTVLLVMGLLTGEMALASWSKISARSIMAFVYLIFVGSFVGFTAYNWLLTVSTPARVSTYAYVNPVVALFLGWALGGETLSTQSLWAAVVILLGVVVITARRDSTAEPARDMK